MPVKNLRLRVRQLSTVHAIGDTRVLHKECRSLVDAGYDVALIASHPTDEVVSGVQVLGIGMPRNRFDRATRKAFQLFVRALRERADIYHFHDPELIGVGLALKALGKTVVYDVHEDVPLQIMNKFWIPGWAKRPLAAAARFAERLAGRLLDGIVTATPSIAGKTFPGRSTRVFPAAKTVVVQNFPEVGLAAERNETPFESRGNAFVYVGGLSEQQGLMEMLAAFDRLPAGLSGTLAGKFKQREAEARAMPGWSRVHYLGEVGRTEVVAALRDARCGIVLDHPITNYVDAYSTKMFEYMACGIPVICSNFPLWDEIVEQTGCGVTVDPFDIDAAASALTTYNTDPALAAEVGERGRQAILTTYNWGNEFARLTELYERIS